MSKLGDIKKVIAPELKSFEVHFKKAMRSKVPLLEKITYYIVKRKGKQIRPMFVYLSAKICGETNDSSHVAASMVEILHTATLVHDDVVDEAYERRSVFTVNALWKNKIAVLVGDYLFAKGLDVSLANNDFEILKIMNVAVQEVIEGELLQSEKARRLDITEEVYYDIIKRKTASLIAAACGVGAASTAQNKADIEQMRLFGEKIGIAFQIKDDLFDFGADDVGKPRGIDIKEKKMTLPLIYALNHADKTTKKRIINTIKRHNEDSAKVAEVIQYVNQSGGIEYAKAAMYQYREEAFELLKKFPDSPVKTALKDLVIFVTERKK